MINEVIILSWSKWLAKIPLISPSCDIKILHKNITNMLAPICTIPIPVNKIATIVSAKDKTVALNNPPRQKPAIIEIGFIGETSISSIELLNFWPNMELAVLP